jgi:hypothetical protein
LKDHDLAIALSLFSAQVFDYPSKVMVMRGADFTTSIPDLLNDLVFPHSSILQEFLGRADHGSVVASVNTSRFYPTAHRRIRDMPTVPRQ